jgi:exonuclease SbcC
MALLENFFKPSFLKPKWQHKDPTVRKLALAKLNDEKILAQIADQDSDLSVRSSALAKIKAPQQLAAFLVCEQAELRQQAQQQHLAYLLPQQNISDLATIKNDNDLVNIATYTQDDALRLAAINKLGSESIRLDIACNNPVSKVRLAAAQGLTKSESLQKLMLIAQGKDKALYRFCKDQIATSKAAEDNAKLREDKITAAINNAQQLGKSAYSPEYNGRLQLLKQNWAALNEQDQQQQQTFNTALVKCEDVLAEHVAEEKAVQDKLIAIASAKESFITLLAQLEALELSDPSAELEAEQLSNQLKELEHNWKAAKQVTNPDAVQHKVFENTLQVWLALDNTRTQLSEQKEAFQALIEQSQQLEKSSLSKSQNLQKELTKVVKQLPWKTSELNITLAAPSLLAELDNALQNAIKHNQNLTAHEADSSKQLAQLLSELEGHITEGHLKDANKSHQHVVQAMKKISQQEAKKHQRQYQNLTAQLTEIRDWQGYAATPKKEALCVSMESLVDSEIDPAILADKIHNFQEEWKAIGPIARQDDKILWNRFRAAADKAYLPCKAHFADMAIQRQQNLVNRQALIAQLTDYEASMNWDSADWGIVQKTLDAARETFRSFSPVDRHEHKNSQATLQEISDKIYAHIKEEYQRNIEAKEALINQAKALQDVADLSQAIEQSKQLQADWKTIGMTPNKADQKMWQEFRVACDAVFSRRDEQRQQNKVHIEASIEQAQAIIIKAEAAAQATNTESKEALQLCSSEFAELSLPGALYGKLRKRLTDAQQQQDDLCSQDKVAKKQQAWITLTDKLSAISLKAQNTEQADALYKADATDFKLPKGIDKSLVESKWKDVSAEQSSTELSNSDALRDACIALEIAAELESPAEDQRARMAYQVQRLAQGLGQTGSLQQQINDSVSQWLALNADQAWQQRYNQALIAAAKQL